MDSNAFSEFLLSYFEGKKTLVEYFDSGCSMIYIYLGNDLLSVQLEPTQIGISVTHDFEHFVEYTTVPQKVFYSVDEAEKFIRNLG
ncbi:hypothetical protein ACWKWU_00360 [Chitinophaga lutea]